MNTQIAYLCSFRPFSWLSRPFIFRWKWFANSIFFMGIFHYYSFKENSNSRLCREVILALDMMMALPLRVYGEPKQIGWAIGYETKTSTIIRLASVLYVESTACWVRPTWIDRDEILVTVVTSLFSQKNPKKKRIKNTDVKLSLSASFLFLVVMFELLLLLRWEG